MGEGNILFSELAVAVRRRRGRATQMRPDAILWESAARYVTREFHYPVGDPMAVAYRSSTISVADVRSTAAPTFLPNRRCSGLTSSPSGNFRIARKDSRLNGFDGCFDSHIYTEATKQSHVRVGDYVTT